ncbi:MAG: response regulator [Pseudomonadota bacterium]|nr:response regulator [Pseudomonadota bacterium]
MPPAPSDATVYIIDDDASVREAMAWLLRTRRLLPECFDSAEAFEAALGQTEPSIPGCLLLDVRMPGMSGLTLFDRLDARAITHVWPVIFLTGHADVPTAVDAVKRGAFDFCEKPFSDNALVDRVEQALAMSCERLAQMQAQRALRARLDELTERERGVLHLVAEGKPNKLIADALGISVRTVEVHRARVFEKMEVKSAVELARLLQSL